jgi:hypothetical protein
MGKLGADVAGQRFGRLTAIEKVRNKRNEPAWRCVCDCGKEKIAVVHKLTSGHTVSCGCARTKHGTSHTRAYEAIKNAIKRCSNPDTPGWDRYGGRGITVCERWLRDPAAFVADMGEPKEGFTLERLDVHKGYEPGNCVWATRQDQARNRENTLMVSFRNETKSLAEWADILNVRYLTLYKRLGRGWSVEQAFTIPMGQRLKRIE